MCLCVCVLLNIGVLIRSHLHRNCQPRAQCFCLLGISTHGLCLLLLCYIHVHYNQLSVVKKLLETLDSLWSEKSWCLVLFSEIHLHATICTCANVQWLYMVLDAVDLIQSLFCRVVALGEQITHLVILVLFHQYQR